MRAISKTLATALAISTCYPLAATAQDDGWDFFGSLYTWVAETNIEARTPSGSVSGTLSFSDVLENLEMVFMGSFEARKARWSLLADLFYIDLAFRDSVDPTSGFTNARFSNEIVILSGLAAYQVYDNQNVSVDLGAGLRYIHLDSDLTLRGTGPSVTFGSSDGATDIVIATRANLPLSNRTSATFYLDYGFGSGDEYSWQALATLDYALTERWTLRGGYRYLEFERDVGTVTYDFDLSGLILGATYQF
ncbi:MAG: DUF481 domain-containing protein [Pseudomonadota bacterium]